MAKKVPAADNKTFDIFDALYSLSKRNKAVANLRGFRFKNNQVIATDTITTLTLDWSSNLDCLVAAPLFMESMAPTKSPKIEQGEGKYRNTLHILEGNYTADLALQSTETFDKVVKQPGLDRVGTPVTSDLIEVGNRILPFFKVESSQTLASVVFFQGGYAYMTDNIIVTRSKTTFIPSKITAVPRAFLDLLVMIGKEDHEIYVGTNSIQAWFDGGILETAIINRRPPVSFPNLYSQLDNVSTKVYPEVVMEGLKTICKYGSKQKAVILCNEEGIAVKDVYKAIIKVHHPMPTIRFKAEHLARILNLEPAMNMEVNPNKFLIFKCGEGEEAVDGFLTVS